MNGTVKKLLIGAGIGAGLALCGRAISLAITKKMMGVALDRSVTLEEGSEKEKLMQSPELLEAMAAAEASAKALENSGCEEVVITAFDGISLVGHWQSCESPKRVIVAMHGWRSSWTSDFGVIADFYRKQDCCVLYAEQRGQGESGGDYMGFGLLERYDCLSWVRWVNERTGGKLPVYLGGVSMGATTVLMATGLDLPSNVCGVVADCGFTSPYAIWKHVSEKNLHLPYGPRSKVVDDICRKRINFGAKDYSCADALAVCKVPVLFVHGTDDRFVPVEMTYENYKACASSKRLLIVPGAEHAMSYLVEQQRYEQAVIDFWSEYDAAADAPNGGVCDGQLP